VKRVKNIVDQELGFTADHNDEAKRRTSFLAIVDKRVVGMVIVESIEKAYILLSSSSSEKNGSHAALSTGLERSNTARPADLGIHQMWVHHKYRTKGIASTLVDAARSKMVFGYTVPVDRLAFSSPTESGVRFARRYNARHGKAADQHSGSSSSNSSRANGFDITDSTNLTVDVLVYDCC